MNRRVARAVHEATNITYWFEKPDWDSGNPALNLVCKGLRSLPFSVHETQKRAFFDTTKLIAVSGESVVVTNGDDQVDKYMFRYPGKMVLETFRDQVSHEVQAVTECLGGVALATQVSIKPAKIFKHARTPLLTVVQTQKKLDLGVHKALDVSALAAEAPSPGLDNTARGLEAMLLGADLLMRHHDYYPDISRGSGNVRRSTEDGAVTLIDVMPFYANGSRLIGDKPPGVVSRLTESLRTYEEFVGQYGG